MKTLMCLVTGTMLVVSFPFAGEVASGDALSVPNMQQLVFQPICFTENMGQWDDRVRFRADVAGAVVWFTKDGVYYQLIRQTGRIEQLADVISRFGPRKPQHNLDALDSIESVVTKVAFLGANQNPHISGQEQVEYRCNFFIGDDPAAWRTNVPNYKSVLYEDIYPGIDLRYYSSGGKLQHELIIEAGADSALVDIHCEGVEALPVDELDDLMIETERGTIKESMPGTLQSNGNSERDVPPGFVVQSGQTDTDCTVT